MKSVVDFTLSFSGSNADSSEIDFYDVSQALVGFQRSLAITTHLVVNNKVITKSPSLKGASILVSPPDEGSWKISAGLIVAAGIYSAGTAPRDTPVGHLVSSAYDYVISETLGFHVDYESTIGQQYEQMQLEETDLKQIEQSQLDSVIEKTEVAIRNMHRPIIKSMTADAAGVVSRIGSRTRPLGQPFDSQTYEYMSITNQDKRTRKFQGRVSSYNRNTYTGRIYVLAEKRPIPFELAPEARTPQVVRLITASLSASAQDLSSGNLVVTALRNLSHTERTKSLYVVDVKTA